MGTSPLSYGVQIALMQQSLDGERQKSEIVRLSSMHRPAKQKGSDVREVHTDVSEVPLLPAKPASLNTAKRSFVMWSRLML